MTDDPFPIKSILILLFLAFFAGADVKSQQLQNSLSSGSSNSLNITINNTFGVTTSANHNSNMISNNNAVLVLEPGSRVTDNIGENGDSLSADFIVTPTGANTSIQGINSTNNFVFGAGTSFSSSLQSIDNPDPSLPIRGNASAGVQHSLGIKVDQVNSSFSNSNDLGLIFDSNAFRCSRRLHC